MLFWHFFFFPLPLYFFSAIFLFKCGTAGVFGSSNEHSCLLFLYGKANVSRSDCEIKKPRQLEATAAVFPRHIQPPSQRSVRGAFTSRSSDSRLMGSPAAFPNMTFSGGTLCPTRGASALTAAVPYRNFTCFSILPGAVSRRGHLRMKSNFPHGSMVFPACQGGIRIFRPHLRPAVTYTGLEIFLQ